LGKFLNWPNFPEIFPKTKNIFGYFHRKMIEDSEKVSPDAQKLLQMTAVADFW